MSKMDSRFSIRNSLLDYLIRSTRSTSIVLLPASVSLLSLTHEKDERRIVETIIEGTGCAVCNSVRCYRNCFRSNNVPPRGKIHPPNRDAVSRAFLTHSISTRLRDLSKPQTLNPFLLESRLDGEVWNCEFEGKTR